jgi:uncharacterized protein (DUF608 family)
MRRVEFKAETNDSGEMKFRSMSLLDDQPWEMLPATDGQLGTIVRLCREWKLSGDDDFLRELWPMAKRALEFSISYWDSDRDGVLDSKQHNTYDIEFFGPNSLSNSVFFAALLAGARMADYLGEKEAATHYAELASRGSARMDELLWNGEYYQQDLSDVDEHRYQYGSGCLSDQLFGQFLAHVASLGYVLPREHVKSAMAAVHRYNLKQDVGTVASVQRIYALPGEPGLLLCTWPRGGRPRIPFVYSDEVWTGIEYQVASGLIFEGLVEEGLDIVRAARSRHDGYRRNPWNEVECGNHYARSMSSWGLLIALSGIAIDLPAGRVQVAPRINGDNFHCFFSTGKSWGIVHHTVDTAGNASVRWEVLYGDPPHSPLPIEGR